MDHYDDRAGIEADLKSDKGGLGLAVVRKRRLAALRTSMLNHLYHHRGQLTVYLRLLDVPLPMVYGPTADENPFT